jgi:hypothetical protein
MILIEVLIVIFLDSDVKIFVEILIAFGLVLLVHNLLKEVFSQRVDRLASTLLAFTSSLGVFLALAHILVRVILLIMDEIVVVELVVLPAVSAFVLLSIFGLFLFFFLFWLLRFFLFNGLFGVFDLDLLVFIFLFILIILNLVLAVLLLFGIRFVVFFIN